MRGGRHTHTQGRQNYLPSGLPLLRRLPAVIIAKQQAKESKKDTEAAPAKPPLSFLAMICFSANAFCLLAAMHDTMHDDKDERGSSICLMSLQSHKKATQHRWYLVFLRKVTTTSYPLVCTSSSPISAIVGPCKPSKI